MSGIPILFIFSGLPGTGKSTLAKMLSNQTGATYLRIDTIEQAIHQYCQVDVVSEGYQLAYRIAEDNLTAGNNVVADSCNPLEITRNEWTGIATNTGAEFSNIEIICTNKAEHRTRVETRASEVRGLTLPTWEQVENREYHPWSIDRIVVDTANKTINTAFAELTDKLGAC